MKLKTWRVQKVNGAWNMPDLPGDRKLRMIILWMMDLLERHKEITEYESFEQLDKFLMLHYWDSEGMNDNLDPALFWTWFFKKATYPDYIKRARLWLVQQELVDVPEHIRRDAKGKAQYIQHALSRSA